MTIAFAISPEADVRPPARRITRFLRNPSESMHCNNIRLNPITCKIKGGSLLETTPRLTTFDFCKFSCLCLMVLAGCGSGSAYYPAGGVVKLSDGTPCDGALVVFHPQDAGKENDPKPVAECDAQGVFQLTTMSPQDGAAAGTYGVTVVWNAAPGKESKFSLSSESSGGADRLKGKYGMPQSPLLNAKIEAQSDNRFEFILD